TEVDATPPPLKGATQLVTGGRDTKAYHGFVNPPGHHASTVLYPRAEDTLPVARVTSTDAGGRQPLRQLKMRCARSKGPRVPALPCCHRVSQRFQPRSSRCSTLAITCWSPTAPISPRASFAIPCFGATESAPHTTIL